MSHKIAIITYKSSQAEAGEVVKQVEALGAHAVAVQLDVAARDSYLNFAAVAQAVLEKLGATKFDFLVNNAGIGLSQPFAETTEAQFDEMTNIHFKSVFFLSQTLLPLINDGGHIINISTGTSRFVLPGYSIYASLKTAVEGLTRLARAKSASTSWPRALQKRISAAASSGTIRSSRK